MDMGIFNSILAKIGFGDDAEDVAAAAPIEAATDAVQSAATNKAAPVAMNSVDVMAKLEDLSSKSSQKLNWNSSIVDLLKLLGLDSSYGVRKELAKELGCPDEKMAESAQMNMWLHKTVLQKLAANGGNIPADLLD